MARTNVKAFSLRKDDKGGGQAAIKGSADNFPASYAYGLPNGTSVNIPIKTNVIPDDQDILPHMINLTNQVFNKDNVADYGTLGCLVKPTGAEYRRTVPDDLLP